MKKTVNNFLSKDGFTPLDVDRLIISAYVQINEIPITNNLLLQRYLIDEWDVQTYELLQNFIVIIRAEYNSFNFENLIELFEFVISPSDRLVNGAIYTPEAIREYIVTQAVEKIGDRAEQAKIADIACGCGGFLLTAAILVKRAFGNSYEYIFRNQIFGLDIQEYSVVRSKLLLSILALSEGEDIREFHFNIYQGDALEFQWVNAVVDFVGFEIVVGNPPYVCARNLEDTVKENLRNWRVSNSGNPDLYIPFFQIGFENLVQNGILGYITMNTFFKSLNGRALRAYFKDNGVAVRIIDFGTTKIFKLKSAYTCICFLENINQDYVEYYRSTERELPAADDNYQIVPYSRLDSKNGWNLDKNEIITRIENFGKPLGERYKTRHGIATLRNDLFIFKPVDEDADYYYIESDGRQPIEKGICRNILNSNKLSRSIDFDSVVEKVIFPYTNDQKPKILEEEFLMSRYPSAYRYLETKRLELDTRDKGKGNYEKWFAFGRTQSLEKVGNKLFFPKFSDRIPSYLMSNDEDLLFYNGQAIVGHSDVEMQLIKKIMESRLFWFYIKTTSKPYSSDYYSLNGTYIKNFGIPDFSQKEIDFILLEDDREILDQFMENVYDINLVENIVV